MWLLVLAIVLLSVSAIFAAYLTEFYTTSFEIAKFAKAVSMALILAGEAMLFVVVGWWAIAGLVAVWLLFTVSRVFWHERFESYLESGVNPYRTFRDQ